MPIPVITNFSINDTQPMDDRFVATSSVSMNNIQFKYPGLTVYRTDENKNYQYDGSDWAIFSSGIYGGSGLLAGDVVVDTTADSTQRDPGTYGNPGTVGYQNLDFIISASSSTSNRSYVRHFFRTKETGVLATSQEYVMAFQGLNNPTSTDYSGIKFNSLDGLGGTKNGAVSIWTTPLTGIGQSSLRFQVEGDGTIRFKPNSGIQSFLNITGNSTNTTTIQLGFNWEGTSRSISGIGSSYIEFKNEEISFYNLKSTSSTATKTLTINEDSLTAYKNFFVNAPGTFIGLSTGGFRYALEGTFGSQTPYVYIAFRSGQVTTDIIRYNATGVRVLKDIEIGSPSNFTSTPQVNGNSSALATYGPFNARYYTNIWDNKFVSDASDNQWVFQSDESENTLSTSTYNQLGNSVCVVKEEFTDQVQDTYFQMIPRSYLPGSVSKSVWELSSQPFDRMIYFHLDHLEDAGTPRNFTHHLSWYLTDVDPIVGGGEGVRAWKKIGKLETGNRNGINMMTASYSVPYYSQQVLVPANMYMKLIFKFPYSIPTANLSWPAASEDYRNFRADLPILVVTSIRSGLFSTGKFSRGPIDSISGTDYLKNE